MVFDASRIRQLQRPLGTLSRPSALLQRSLPSIRSGGEHSRPRCSAKCRCREFTAGVCPVMPQMSRRMGMQCQWSATLGLPCRMRLPLPAVRRAGRYCVADYRGSARRKGVLLRVRVRLSITSCTASGPRGAGGRGTFGHGTLCCLEFGGMKRAVGCRVWPLERAGPL